MQHREDHAAQGSGIGKGASGVGSSFGRFARLRSASHGSSKAPAAVKDQWLIPYNGPITTSAPTSVPLLTQSNIANPEPAQATSSAQPKSHRTMQGGIGESPAPVHRSGGGLSGFWDSLSGGGSGSSSTAGYGRTSDDSIKRQNGGSRRSRGLDESFAFPKQRANQDGMWTFPRQSRSSHDTMDFKDSTPVNLSRSRLPSSTSVPTGLAAPPLLFSPTHRGMTIRASGSVPDFRDSVLQSSTDSLPLSGGKRQPQSSRRWNAPTACDTFVLPRPKLVAHTITPPVSPDKKDKGKGRADLVEFPSPSPSDAMVLQEGAAREQEREEWARKARGRGRSLSFSSLGRSELANSSLVNVRSRSRSQSRSRASSTDTRKEGRVRSYSFGSRWTRGSRKTESEATQSRQNSQRSTATSAGRRQSKVASVPVGRACGHDSGPKRVPSLMDDRDTDDPFSSRQISSERDQTVMDPIRPEGRSTKTTARELRFKQVAPVDANGVVIIAHQQKTASDGSEGRRRATSVASADKPLPALPRPSRKPVSAALSTESQEIGVAISPNAERTQTRGGPSSSMISPSPQRPQSSSIHARTLLQREHQRSLTKRAFQNPTFATRSRPAATATSPATPLPSTPVAATWQRGHYPSSSVPSAAPSPVPSSRRQSTMEEAVGRGRAASAGQGSKPFEVYPGSPASHHTSTDGFTDAQHRAQILAAAGMLPSQPESNTANDSDEPRSIRPEIIPLGAPINTTPQRPVLDTSSGHASSISSADWLTPQHSLLRAALDASSPLTAGHSTDSSPIQTFDEEDYKNLFYHAPTSRPAGLAGTTWQNSPLSPYQSPAGHGLGLGVESESVDSDSVDETIQRHGHGSVDLSEGTVEIVTPVHATYMAEKQSGSSRSSALGPASLQGSNPDPRALLPPPQIVDSDDYPFSADDSPPMLDALENYGGRRLPRIPSGLTQSSSDHTVHEDDFSVRFSQVQVGQAVHVATPPLPSEELPRHIRRTSVVPERGSSSQDDLALLTTKSSIPNLPVIASLSPQPETPRQSFYDDKRHSAAVSFMAEFPSPPRQPASSGMVRRDTFGTWDELANLSNEPIPADESDEELEPPRLNRLESMDSTATSDSYATAREGFSSSVEG